MDVDRERLGQRVLCANEKMFLVLTTTTIQQGVCGTHDVPSGVFDQLELLDKQVRQPAGKIDVVVAYDALDALSRYDTLMLRLKLDPMIGWMMHLLAGPLEDQEEPCLPDESGERLTD